MAKNKSIDLEHEARFMRLESAVEKHLMESGYIKTDLEWLKKGVWTCAVAALTSVGGFITALIMFLLRAK